MPEEKKEKKDSYVLKEIVTQTDIAIGKSDSDTAFNDKELLLEILNKLDRIEKAII